MKPRKQSAVIASSALFAMTTLAMGQNVMTAVECTGYGGRVTFTLSGFSGTTCGLTTELEVVGDEIRLAYRPYDGDGGCGATVTQYCFLLATAPLRDGEYRVMTSVDNGPYQETDRVVLACRGRALPTPFPLGGPDGADGVVRAMAVIDLDGDGPEPESLVVAGEFTQIGGIDARGVARWDGAAWHALGEGLDGLASAVAFHDGSVYVGGRFSSAGGVAARNIARWDGKAWHALGSGVEESQIWSNIPAVLALGSFRGELVAAGFFLSAGGVPVQHIARWDGEAWRSLGVGIQHDAGGWSPPSHVTALAHFEDDLIVGGHFAGAGGLAANGLARWDGESWDVFPDGQPSIAFAFPEGRLTAVNTGWSFFGYCPGSSVHIWDGANWLQTGSGLPGTRLAAATVHDDRLVVASGGAYAGTCCRNETLRWNGVRWERLGEADGRFYSLGVFRGELIAGGSFSEVNGIQVSNIMRWGARCRADFNMSGVVDSEDFFAFLSAFGVGGGEFNGDGVIDSRDLFDFLAAFFGGCA